MCQNWTSALDTRPKFGTFIQKSGQVRSIRFKFQTQNTPLIWPLKSARIKRTCPNLEQTILEGFSKERSLQQKQVDRKPQTPPEKWKCQEIDKLRGWLVKKIANWAILRLYTKSILTLKKASP